MKLPAVLAAKRLAFGIGPGSIDHQSVHVALLEHGTDLFAGLQSALDPAGIEKERETATIARPQFLVEFQKRVRNRLTGGIEQVNVPVSFAPAHRCREVNVEP